MMSAIRNLPTAITMGVVAVQHWQDRCKAEHGRATHAERELRQCREDLEAAMARLQTGRQTHRVMQSTQELLLTSNKALRTRCAEYREQITTLKQRPAPRRPSRLFAAAFAASTVLHLAASAAILLIHHR